MSVRDRILRRGRLFAAAAATVGLLAASQSHVAAQSSWPYPDTSDDEYYAQAVRALSQAGVFAGTECADGFCPAEPIDRATMAVWTVRILDGKDPSPVSSTRFDDVDGAHPWAAFIERFAELGVTRGCSTSPARYCPDDTVTRAQMAVFLKRAFNLLYGPDAGFSDVAAGAWYADAVTALAASEVTKGCTTSEYCPENPTSRAQMAVFLKRAQDFIQAGLKRLSRDVLDFDMTDTSTGADVNLRSVVAASRTPLLLWLYSPY